MIIYYIYNHLKLIIIIIIIIVVYGIGIGGICILGIYYSYAVNKYTRGSGGTYT